MKVLYVASEALPFMASGGLGDVAGSLPVALRKRLIGCRVVMPLYDSIKQEYKDKMKFITSISVPVSWRRQYCGIFEAKYNGEHYSGLELQPQSALSHDQISYLYETSSYPYIPA